jgi:hypothetical protein
MELVGELFRFMWTQKKFWLFPMVLVLAIFGVLFVLSQGTAVAPFIYTLF